jgi:glutamine---fructose-6-phosphate transaminase (isomerizing)
MDGAAATHMEREARETPAVAARLVERAEAPLARIAQRLREQPPLYAMALGRGSSDAAALLAKYLFETRLGLPTVSVAPSVQSIYGARLRLDRALLLAISQSGRSPDLVEFCRAATGPDVLRLGFLNDANGPLAHVVDLCVPLEAGPEQSIAATKSCIAAMLLVFGLAAHWLEDAAMIAAFRRAPDVLARALEQGWPEAEAFLDGDGSLYVIGRGPGLAIAAEGALKLKETCGLHAEAVSAAEIRHGPFALAGPGLRAIVFAPNDASLPGLREVADALGRQGARVSLIAADPALSSSRVDSDPEPILELTAMLLRFYLVCNAAALRRDRSPDVPPLLTKITETR